MTDEHGQRLEPEIGCGSGNNLVRAARRWCCLDERVFAGNDLFCQSLLTREGIGRNIKIAQINEYQNRKHRTQIRIRPALNREPDLFEYFASFVRPSLPSAGRCRLK
jgi:hypothetical protein